MFNESHNKNAGSARKFFEVLRCKLVKNIFIYTSSNILKSTLPFLLLPVLTRYLSPADYGIIATFEVLLMFFTILLL